MYVPKILILSLTKFTHMQFVDVFALNLEAPIQHVSDFCRFSFNELNVRNSSVISKIVRSAFIFSEFSYVNLNFGIKKSKIGLKFAEQWLPKAKLIGPA